MKNAALNLKRWVSVLLIAALCCMGFALAQESYVGDMEVINCKEWVSLRVAPNTESERIAKIPLGSIVSDCYVYDDGWVFGLYCGNYGYITADYLMEAEQSADDSKLYAEHNGVLVVGNYDYGSDYEVYEIEAFDASGRLLWDYTARCNYSTELTLVAGFVGGTEDAPMIMAYSASDGLTALDFETGAVLWQIPESALSLGGIQYTVDTDGTLYAGGYYGPDPAAVSVNGEILWQCNFNDGYIWLSKLTVEGDVLRCRYDSDGDDSVVDVLIDKTNGNFIGLEYNAE